MRRAVCIAMMAFLAAPALAEPIRLATYSASFSRDGPGLLLRDLIEGDAQSDAGAAVIAEVRPDILLLTEFDYDAGGAALAALATRLAAQGVAYPHRFTARPNTGIQTGLDLNRNGVFYEGEDAQGFGEFPGDGGMALLSRWPIISVVDLTPMLWADLPGGHARRVLNNAALAHQGLPTTAHWIVTIQTPSGPLTLLAFAATAPVFDGPEDLNGFRNADEILLWQRLLDGALEHPAPAPPYVILGRFNLDPLDGEGQHNAIAALLADKRLQDPRPMSEGGRNAPDPGQTGPPELDTADWPDGAPGNLRVDYILPSADMGVRAAAVHWPPEMRSEAQVLPGSDANAAGAHKMVWMDVDFD